MKADEVQKVIIASGRHCYNLEDQRKTLGVTNTAIIRLESLCPFPTLHLQDEIAKYKNAKCKFSNKNIYQKIKRIKKLLFWCRFYLESRGTSKYGSLEFCEATI